MFGNVIYDKLAIAGFEVVCWCNQLPSGAPYQLGAPGNDLPRLCPDATPLLKVIRIMQP